jgi:hypothetical protein
MEIAILLFKLYESLLSPDFLPENAIESLGPVTKKTTHRWVLAPKNNNYSNTVLLFENLPAGRHLMTTIEITFKDPFVISLTDLESVFGKKDRWHPPTNIGAPNILHFFTKQGKPLKGVVLFRVEKKGLKNNKKEDLIISSVLLRRIFSK